MYSQGQGPVSGYALCFRSPFTSIYRPRTLASRWRHWASLQGQLAKLAAFCHTEEGALEVIRISACDGRLVEHLDPAVILPTWRWDECILGTKFSGVESMQDERRLTQGEIGCALSHVEASPGPPSCSGHVGIHCPQASHP